MNKDEIIAMLRASCDKDKVDPEQNGFWVIVTKELETFAKLVAQHEREACEALCKWRTGVQQVDAAIDTCAAAIRARGQA
jgi:hypothetical protein